MSKTVPGSGYAATQLQPGGLRNDSFLPAVRRHPQFNKLIEESWFRKPSYEPYIREKNKHGMDIL